MNRRKLLALIGLAPLAHLATKAVVEAAPELSPWRGGEPVFLAPRDPFIGEPGTFDEGLRMLMKHNARVISELVPTIYKA